MRRAAALGALALAVAGCGGGSGRLTVFAASSLTDVFQQLDPDARFDFAGSDDLAFQLEQGAKADVYASATPEYADELFSKGLAARPRVFATNRLVLIVPGSSPARPSLHVLLERDVKLVLGARGVPAGDYARDAIARYCRTVEGTCPLAKVVSEEQDVKGVVAKVALGEADAGFVYATDARAAGRKVKAFELPSRLQPPIRYELAVLSDGDSQRAERFVQLVLGPRGREALSRAGFGLP